MAQQGRVSLTAFEALDLQCDGHLCSIVYIVKNALWRFRAHQAMALGSGPVLYQSSAAARQSNPPDRLVFRNIASNLAGQIELELHLLRDFARKNRSGGSTLSDPSKRPAREIWRLLN
jgi:hypothetical protein